MFNLIGVTGRFGSGKSLYALQEGLRVADKFRKNLVVNFDVNEKAIRFYCRAVGFRWFAANGRVIRIELFSNINELFIKPKFHPVTGASLQPWVNRDSVTIFDEGGVFANSRAWSSLPKEFLQRFTQLRKLNIHLFIVFQFADQVDRQFRILIQEWVLCRSFGFYSRKLKGPKMLGRIAYTYDPEKFWRLEEDTKARGNVLLPWLWAKRVYWRLLFVNYWVYFVRLVLCELLKISLIYTPWKLKKLKYPYHLESLLFRCFDTFNLVGGSQVSERSRVHKILSTSDYEKYQLEKSVNIWA